MGCSVLWDVVGLSYLSNVHVLFFYPYNIDPREAVPEVSKSKGYITQKKHVPIKWFVTTASQSRI